MNLAPPAPNSALDSPELSPRPDARDTLSIARVASHALSFSGSDSETGASPSRFSNNASPAASQHSGVASVSPARSASAKLATLAALGLVHGPLPASVSTPACSAAEESGSYVEGRMQLGNGGSWSASASIHTLAPNAAPSGEAVQRPACCAAESAQASAEASTRPGLRSQVCARTCCKRTDCLILGVEGFILRTAACTAPASHLAGKRIAYVATRLLFSRWKEANGGYDGAPGTDGRVQCASRHQQRQCGQCSNWCGSRLPRCPAVPGTACGRGRKSCWRCGRLQQCRRCVQHRHSGVALAFCCRRERHKRQRRQHAERCQREWRQRR